MKKIAIITDTLCSGGVAKVALTLGDLFDTNNYTVTIYSVLDNDLPTNLEINCNVNVNSNKQSYLRRLRSIYLELNNKPCDFLLVLTMGKLSVFTSLFTLGLKKTKCFVCEHISFNSYPRVVRLLKYITYPFYDKVILLTEHDRRLLGRVFNTVSIYNPTPFKISKIAKQQYHGRFLAVGHLIHRKGYDRLLPIWKDFQEKNPTANLTIVGCGEKYDELMFIINGLQIKNITFIESTNEIERYYKENDVLLCTSRAEGLPMTFIEAQAHGMPLISYDIETGPAEIIDGSNGFLITDGNETDFLDAMEKIKKNTVFVKMSLSSLECAENFTPFNILDDWKRQLDGR